MQSRYALLAIFHSVLILIAVSLLIAALSQPLFAVRTTGMLGSSVAIVMGYEDSGFLYFSSLIVVMALTVLIWITRLRWPNALRSTHLPAYTILFSVILLTWPLQLYAMISAYAHALDSAISLYYPLEGFYTYCLSCILLVVASALGPPIAARKLSLSVDVKSV